MTSAERIGKILGVPPETLLALESAMVRAGKSVGVLDRVALESEEHVARMLGVIIAEPRASVVRERLRETLLQEEEKLMALVATIPGETEFEKAATLARRVARVGKGFFLKKEYAAKILMARPPEHLLKFLGISTVEELLAQHDVTEAFSALRFMESDAWMHETFDAAYSAFTVADFEEREIELKVLGPKWKEVAKKFVEKKRHNVSHLKEFGVIFLNPIREDIAGKFLRDFALLLHYFHEIEFYAKLFRHYAAREDFAMRFKALLRGDVKEVVAAGEGEWLIVQRYLFKENPHDPRLLLPRVNPESLHWLRGERDLTDFARSDSNITLEFWNDLDWVGGIFPDSVDPVSFDIEDNAMQAVAIAEGKSERFFYHQREALWTKLFIEYAGGEAAAEELLTTHFEEGIVRFV